MSCFNATLLSPEATEQVIIWTRQASEIALRHFKNINPKYKPKAHLWDLVAGAAILTRAGRELRYLSGRPVDYLELLDGRLTPEPIIAGHPRVLDELPDSILPHQS